LCLLSEVKLSNRSENVRVWRHGRARVVVLTFISLQFELGPLSEASIGNVGMRDPNKMAWGTW